MSNSLRGTNICFTGEVDGFTRAELQQIAVEYGFLFQTAVTKKTNILVIGTAPGKTKVDRATELGVKMWGQQDFLLMLGQDDADDVPIYKPKVSPEEAKAKEMDRLSFYNADTSVGSF